MSRRRACGIDYGGARVGVAVSDELGLLAHPRPFLQAEPRNELLRSLKDLAREDEITRFIVGLPLDMRGGEGPSARKARTFAQELANAVGLDVELWDERLSTVQANRALQAAEVNARDAKKRIDSASAVVILQAWLDQQATKGRSR